MHRFRFLTSLNILMLTLVTVAFCRADSASGNLSPTVGAATVPEPQCWAFGGIYLLGLAFLLSRGRRTL